MLTKDVQKFENANTNIYFIYNRNDEKQEAAPEAQEAQVTPSKSSGDFELREFEEGAVIA